MAQLFVCKITLCGGFHEINEIGVDAEHHGFCLRITHAHVVFNHHRFATNVDQSQEDESAVVDAVGYQSLNGGENDAFGNFFHECVVGKRHGTYCAHSSGVEAGVALSDTFVVLGDGEHAVAAVAVREDEYGAFNSAEEFFNHDGS